jgi:primase-polymerase (primpol)-like protein
VLWRYEDRGASKPTKVPYTAMGYRASCTNPEHWSEYGYLIDLLRNRPSFAAGLGFVFTGADPYCGIDLDSVWQSDADEGATWAIRILERFSDTYSEMSPSEAGVKIWCWAKAPRCGSWPVEDGAIEIYDRARYFAVTGKHAGVLAITGHQADVEALITNLDEGQHTPQARAIPEIIPHGTQHNTLISLAGTMRRRGMSIEAIEAALLEVNRTQCEKPGPEENIIRIARSVEKWPR